MSDIAVGLSKFIKCNVISLLFLMNYIFIQGASTLMNQRSIYSLIRHGVRALVTIQGVTVQPLIKCIITKESYGSKACTSL